MSRNQSYDFLAVIYFSFKQSSENQDLKNKCCVCIYDISINQWRAIKINFSMTISLVLCLCLLLQ